MTKQPMPQLLLDYLAEHKPDVHKLLNRMLPEDLQIIHTADANRTRIEWPDLPAEIAKRDCFDRPKEPKIKHPVLVLDVLPEQLGLVAAVDDVAAYIGQIFAPEDVEMNVAAPGDFQRQDIAPPQMGEDLLDRSVPTTPRPEPPANLDEAYKELLTSMGVPPEFYEGKLRTDPVITKQLAQLQLIFGAPITKVAECMRKTLTESEREEVLRNGWARKLPYSVQPPGVPAPSPRLPGMPMPAGLWAYLLQNRPKTCAFLQQQPASARRIVAEHGQPRTLVTWPAIVPSVVVPADLPKEQWPKPPALPDDSDMQIATGCLAIVLPGTLQMLDQRYGGVRDPLPECPEHGAKCFVDVALLQHMGVVFGDQTALPRRVQAEVHCVSAWMVGMRTCEEKIRYFNVDWHMLRGAGTDLAWQEPVAALSIPFGTLPERMIVGAGRTVRKTTSLMAQRPVEDEVTQRTWVEALDKPIRLMLSHITAGARIEICPASLTGVDWGDHAKSSKSVVTVLEREAYHAVVQFEDGFVARVDVNDLVRFGYMPPPATPSTAHDN